MLLLLVVSGLWIGEKSCFNGVYHCWIGCKSYSGVLRGVWHWKLWGIFFLFQDILQIMGIFCLFVCLLSGLTGLPCLCPHIIYLLIDIFIGCAFCRKYHLLLFLKLLKFLLMAVGLVFIETLTSWSGPWDVWEDRFAFSTFTFERISCPLVAYITCNSKALWVTVVGVIRSVV